MYLEFILFVAFVFFSVLDIRHRQIKAYWFVILAITALVYKLIFELDYFVSDFFMFSVSAVFLAVMFACRILALADLLGLLIISFAIPTIGPIPLGLPMLILIIVLQNWVIITSNTAYNISDLYHNRTIFDDNVTNKGKLKGKYWYFLARRRRQRDKFVLSAEKTTNDSSIITLSIKRGNILSPDTRYVFSAHPQFVLSIVKIIKNRSPDMISAYRS